MDQGTYSILRYIMILKGDKRKIGADRFACFSRVLQVWLKNGVYCGIDIMCIFVTPNSLI